MSWKNHADKILKSIASYSKHAPINQAKTMKTIGLLAVAQAQVLNDDSCHSVKWEKEKIAFKVESDGQVFASENLLRRYVERNDELT